MVRFQEFTGGDKRDRTADLMTARWRRFVISGIFSSNMSVQSTKSAIFHAVLSTASMRFFAHLGQNLGQGSRARLETFFEVKIDCSLHFADSQVKKRLDGILGIIIAMSVIKQA